MYLILGILLVAADQFIKFAVRSRMSVGETLPLIDGFFHLTYVQNRGAAFGMFQQGTLFFAAVTILFIGGMAYFTLKYPNISRIWRLALTMIVSGAVGNLIDRLYLGYVVDMFDFRGIWAFIFNFADVCVVTGGLLTILLVLKDEKVLVHR